MPSKNAIEAAKNQGVEEFLLFIYNKGVMLETTEDEGFSMTFPAVNTLSKIDMDKADRYMNSAGYGLMEIEALPGGSVQLTWIPCENSGDTEDEPDE